MAADPVERPRGSDLAAGIAPVLVLLAVMWVTEVLDLVADGRLDRFGIEPRQLSGLDGVVLAPFLHNGFGHLITNTFPFLILGAAICLGSVRRFVQVTVVVGLTSGVGTWLTGGSGTVHIGASGLVFGYVTYLVSRGVFARKVSYLLGGLLVLMVYGGVLWGLIPRPGISWQAHLFGAIGGVVAAWAIYGQRPGDVPG
ncbi:MAG: rhomboid family intramembrane serine protease [Acidimicrobiales bacterium]